MATPISILQRTLNDLKGLILHYEVGLKSRIITLHKEVHPGEEKSDSNILQKELNKCHQSKTHSQINTQLANMDTGISHLSDIVQDLKDRLAGKRQEYSTLCDRIHVQKMIIKDCKATIATMTEEDQRKTDSISSLQVALADKKMELAALENDQQGGRGKGQGDGDDKDPQPSDAVQNAALVLMEQVEKLEEELKVKEAEVEALRTAEGHGSNVLDDDKMTRWENMTEKIINDLHKIEQEFSLSRSLAMQNEELRHTLMARELTIADLSKEIVELKILRYRSQEQASQEQASLDLHGGFDHETRIKLQANALTAGQSLESHITHLRRIETSPATSMIFAQMAGRTDGLIKSPRSDDDEQEDIFEDCVSEQGEAKHTDVEDAGTDSSYGWPGFSTSDTRDVADAVSKSVWQDLSGLDLLGDEEC